jgi:Asp-tRNA(Asn)/Glu-tRNA(Gln) amidotransferase A subunit family amidase
VAAGITPIAIGTDAGGSTRVPASYTGLYGLRPSTGAIARLHGFPATAHDFQVIGLMARTPQDVQMVFSCVVGPDTRDTLSLRYPHARTALFADLGCRAPVACVYREDRTRCGNTARQRAAVQVAVHAPRVRDHDRRAITVAFRHRPC